MLTKINALIDTDILDAVHETATNARYRLRRNMEKVVQGPTAQSARKAISTEPGGVVYANGGKLRWKNKKQRAKVMKELREGGTIPYIRDHSLSRGWSVVLNNLSEGNGVILFTNPSNIWPFVQGDFTQPFHLDTLWPQVGLIISQYSEKLQEETIEAWYQSVQVSKK